MRIAVGSDEKTALTDFLVSELARRGHDAKCFGPMVEEPLQWPQVAERVAAEVGDGRCEQGIVLCWTGTGVCIAANKVPGIRAALCVDPYTAAGARKWNDANVLGLSLRNISQPLLKEILDEWFRPIELTTDDLAQVQYLRQIERDHSDSGSPVRL